METTSSTSILTQIKLWCLSPIGMMVILIIVAAIGIVIAMAIKESCAESDLSYRIFRTLYIAGYICFVLVFASSLLTGIVASFAEILAKIWSTKGSATIFSFALAATFFGLAVLIYGLQQPSDTRSLVFSGPFWILGCFPLIVCATSVYQTVGWIFASIAVEIVAFIVAMYCAAEFGWTVSNEKREREEKAEQAAKSNASTNNDSQNLGAKIIDNIIKETSQVAKNI